LGAVLKASEPGASTLVVRREDLLRLAAALDQLPEYERDAVIAHYILGLRLAEIAKRIERTEKAVANLLFRGLRRLRQLLADSEDLA
jgi:RNA polymerase sigma-70 factor (ECF subfamily)